MAQGLLWLASGMTALVIAGALTGRWGFVPVLTGSMRPGIQPGDLVLVTPEPVSAVRAGQIIDFQPPGQGGIQVAHRVVSVSFGPGGAHIRTKGDANQVEDPWRSVLSGPTAWRVRMVLPRLGYLAVAEQNASLRLVVELALIGGGIASALGVIWRRPDEADAPQEVARAEAARERVKGDRRKAVWTTVI